MSRDPYGRRRLLLAVALCTATLLAVGQPTGQAAMAAGTTVIRCRGSGRVLAPPDRATVELGIESRGTDVALALERNEQTVDRVSRTLRRAGLADSAVWRGAVQVNSERLSIDQPPVVEVTPVGPQPEEIERPALEPGTAVAHEATWESEPGPPVTYTVWNSIRFTTADLDNLPQLLAAALNSGATQVLFVRYELSDDAAYRRQAISLAVRAAVAEAEALADALGVELRRVTEVQLDSPGPDAGGAAQLPLWSSMLSQVAGAPGYVEASVTVLAEVSSLDWERIATPGTPAEGSGATERRRPGGDTPTPTPRVAGQGTGATQEGPTAPAGRLASPTSSAATSPLESRPSTARAARFTSGESTATPGRGGPDQRSREQPTRRVTAEATLASVSASRTARLAVRHTSLAVRSASRQTVVAGRRQTTTARAQATAARTPRSDAETKAEASSARSTGPTPRATASSARSTGPTPRATGSSARSTGPTPRATGSSARSTGPNLSARAKRNTATAQAADRLTASPEARHSADQPGPGIAFRTLVQGAGARYRGSEPLALVVASERQVAAELAPLLPSGLAVDLDFNRYSLLAVFLGEQATATTVDVEAVGIRGNTLVVEARVPATSADKEHPGSPAHAYTLVRLARGDLPSGGQPPEIELRFARP